MTLRTAEELIRYIAEMPLSRDFEYDKFGEIKSGSRSYGTGWSAWHFQQIAREWVRANGERRNTE